MRLGIVSEFNPLHNGHKYLLDTAASLGAECVICSLSGNFVQRGDTAIISKFARAEMALKCGADLVLELPVVYSMSTAQNFALGSIFGLVSAGADTIMFGSECGDIDKLYSVADALKSEEFKNKLSAHLSTGCSFPAARQSALSEIIGDETSKLLENPNDTLGVEYIMAAMDLKAKINFIPVKRIGAEHDSSVTMGNICSATHLRQLILNGNFQEAKHFMPPEAFDILMREANDGQISNVYRLETAIIARLRSMYDSELHSLPDLSEGIENRLIKATLECATLDELYERIKTKRYTMARVRRLVLSAFLRFEKDFFLSTPPYIRILGHTEKGRKILKDAFKDVLTISRAGDLQTAETPKRALRMVEIECTASGLYDLSMERPKNAYREYTQKLLTF